MHFLSLHHIRQQNNRDRKAPTTTVKEPHTNTNWVLNNEIECKHLLRQLYCKMMMHFDLKLATQIQNQPEKFLYLITHREMWCAVCSQTITANGRLLHFGFDSNEDDDFFFFKSSIELM